MRELFVGISLKKGLFEGHKCPVTWLLWKDRGEACMEPRPRMAVTPAKRPSITSRRHRIMRMRCIQISIYVQCISKVGWCFERLLMKCIVQIQWPLYGITEEGVLQWPEAPIMINYSDHVNIVQWPAWVLSQFGHTQTIQFNRFVYGKWMYCSFRKYVFKDHQKQSLLFQIWDQSLESFVSDIFR